jgi:predicted nucleotidyltransferase
MNWSEQKKNNLVEKLVRCLKQDDEIQTIIIFGSFLTAEQPNDLDVAIIQNSEESYLPLALKYRKQTRSVSQEIPLDILPIRKNAQGAFLSEIYKGRIIYEKRNRLMA